MSRQRRGEQPCVTSLIRGSYCRTALPGVKRGDCGQRGQTGTSRGRKACEASRRRVESADSNHLLWPKSLNLIGALDEPVEILDWRLTKRSWRTPRRNTIITRFELERAMVEDRDASFVVDVEGQRIEKKTKGLPQALLPLQYSALARKFLIYKPLGKDVLPRCIWQGKKCLSSQSLTGMLCLVACRSQG